MPHVISFAKLYLNVITTLLLLSGTTHSRFKFAKDAIELRKQGIARGQGAEETVVLAFGGSSTQSTGVLVTRKLRKRQLWKVNNP